MSPEGKENTDTWKFIGGVLLVGALLSLAGTPEVAEDAQDLHSSHVPVTVYPVPTEEYTCHGMSVGENDIFKTNDGNIGRGIVVRTAEGDLGVSFSPLKDMFIYGCDQVTPHE